MTNVIITKGEYSVTIHTVEVTEDFANRLRIIPIPQTKQNQSSGPKDTKITDLLMITHNLMIRGHINATTGKTAKEVLDELKEIFQGAETSGGNATITYDGDSLNIFPEKLTIIKKPLREIDSPGRSIIQYDIQINLVEGTSF